MQQENRPLDDAEQGELERFLANRPGAMSLERLDGLLSALAIGPQLISPSDWLGVALGDSDEGFDDEVQMRRVLELVIRHNKNVVQGFREDWSGLAKEDAIDAMYFPLLDESEGQEEVLGAAWARGFREGLSWLEDAHWEALEADEECMTTLSLIAALDLGTKAEDVPITAAERAELVPAVVAALQYLYTFWRDWLRSQHTPVRADEKPGRNDPCLCGSGKKYKKCCGAPDKLH